MKRFVCIILFAVLCLTFAVSCTEKASDIQVPNGMKLASGESDIYCLFVPNSWTVKRGYDSTAAYYSANDTSNVVVTTYILPSDLTVGTAAEDENEKSPYIDAYWNELKSKAGNTFKNFAVVEEGKEYPVSDGYYAKQYIYTLTADGKDFKYRALVTYFRGAIICFTYTSTAETFDLHQADVDKMLTEFKLLK